MSVELKPKFHSRAQYEAYAKQQNKALLQSLRDSGRFHAIEYVRGPAQQAGFDWTRGPIMGKGKPNGVMVAIEDNEGKLVFGWSAAHSRKEKRFTKVEGLYRAIRRALAEEPVPLPPQRMDLYYRNFVQNSVLELNERMNDVDAKALAGGYHADSPGN